MSRGEDDIRLDAHNAAERRTLAWVLGINASQVVVAGVAGLAADSTGLLGAALDNLGDTLVYVVSLYAVGRTAVEQARAARLSGVLLIASALGLLGEVVRRFVIGSEPLGFVIIAAAALNAATNLVNLLLLRSHRSRGMHMKASWIFTTNDMLANAGIVGSGLAVILFDSPLPDLLVGLAVGAIVIHGGWEILREASETVDEADSVGPGRESDAARAQASASRES